MRFCCHWLKCMKFGNIRKLCAAVEVFETHPTIGCAIIPATFPNAERSKIDDSFALICFVQFDRLRILQSNGNDIFVSVKFGVWCPFCWKFARWVRVESYFTLSGGAHSSFFIVFRCSLLFISLKQNHELNVL